MRKNIYIYNSCLFISVILFFIWSCMDDELIKMDRQTENRNFSLQEAKAFFEKFVEANIETRSGEDEVYKSIQPGDFSPQWENAMPSAKNNLECYDIPIISSFRYKAIYVEYNNDRGIAKFTNVYQKLVVVKNVKENNIGQYILTLIPAKGYDTVYSNRVCMDFLNCADKGKFTGVVIYSMVNSNTIARVNTYKDGIKINGVFLLNASTKAELERKCRIASSQLAGISFGRKKNIFTRSGEDAAAGGDDWNWDIDGGEFPEVVITPEPVINGGEFPEVVITPDNWTPPCPVDPDPYPDSYGGVSEGGDNSSDSSGNFGIDEVKNVDPCQKADEMNANDSLKSRVKKIFAGVYYQPQSKENGWVNDGKLIHDPIKRTQGSLKYDWSVMKPNSIKEWYHSHPGGGPIPSFTDLVTLTKQYNKGYIDAGNFTYGVISDFGCTSLVIVSEEAFRIFVERLQNDKITIMDNFNNSIASHIASGVEDKIAKYITFLHKEKAGLQLIFNKYSEIDQKWEGWKPRTVNSSGQLEYLDCNK